MSAPLVLVAGIAALDDIFPISAPLVAGEKHRSPRVETVLGGNAANAARAICRLGGRAELLARLGDDATAAWIRKELTSEGVGHDLCQPLAGCHTSRSAIIIEPDGARTIANMFDPNFPEEPNWLPQILPPNTAAVLGDVRWEAATLRLLSLARAGGLPAVLDGDRAPKDQRLLAAASHIAFSAQGLRELAGQQDLATALTGFAAGRDQFCAVTDGAHGVFYMDGGNLRHIPAPRVAAVDTLGAGDVWHGAFALALAEQQTIEQAIHFANLAAAIKCSRPGGGAGAPIRAELNTFRHG